MRIAGYAVVNLQTAGALNLGLTDPRTVTPGTPRAFYGGLRFTF